MRKFFSSITKPRTISSDIKLRDMESFEKYRDSVFQERISVENLIAAENRNKESWDLIGFCQVCETATKFMIDWYYSDRITPLFRERLVCQYCGLNNRQRFMASYLKKLLRERSEFAQVYLYEQITIFFKCISEKLKHVSITGSEFFGYDKKPGEIINNIRHEDALNLSFDDKSFDIIISNDIYEHVPDIQKALSEAYRVLKKDGKLLFTVPFQSLERKTRQRAFIKENKTIHVLPEVYHGNPFSEKGSLVFYDFGWDILDMFENAGFRDAYLLTYYSLFYGYIGEGLQFIFVAEK